LKRYIRKKLLFENVIRNSETTIYGQDQLFD